MKGKGRTKKKKEGLEEGFTGFQEPYLICLNTLPPVSHFKCAF